MDREQRMVLTVEGGRNGRNEEITEVERDDKRDGVREEGGREG